MSHSVYVLLSPDCLSPFVKEKGQSTVFHVSVCVLSVPIHRYVVLCLGHGLPTAMHKKLQRSFWISLGLFISAALAVFCEPDAKDFPVLQAHKSMTREEFVAGPGENSRTEAFACLDANTVSWFLKYGPHKIATSHLGTVSVARTGGESLRDSGLEGWSMNRILGFCWLPKTFS
jgi:hypothetical protein